MRYNREETFRYEFGRPLDCEFKIINFNGKEMNTHSGKSKIHDLSPGGLKVSTKLDIPVEGNRIVIQVRFSIISNITLEGKIVWKKHNYNDDYFYGIDLFVDTEVKDKLVDELKNFVKKEKC